MPFLAALAALMLAGPAAASTPFHVATLVELTVDAQPAASAHVDGAFSEGLRGAGFTWVTAEAAGIADVAAARAGEGYPGADLVLVARVEARRLAANIRGTSLTRYEALASAQIIATETGEVLGTVSARAPGIDLDGASAARMAGGHAARRVAEQLSAKLPGLAARRGVDLTVRGLPDGVEATRLAALLANHPAIESAQIRGREGRGKTAKAQIRVTTRGMAAAQLAHHIDLSEGLGLVVESHTLRRVSAIYDPARRVRLGIAVKRLANRTGEAAEDRLLAPLTRVLRTALDQAPGLDVDLEEPPFTVTGRIRYVGETDAAIDLELRGPDAAVIARASASGPGQRFSRTVRRAARQLGREGLARAVSDADVRQIARLPVKLPKAVDPPAPLIAEVELRPALVGSPLVAEVRLTEAQLGDTIEISSGEQAWSERADGASADGRTRVFEGPVSAVAGAVDVAVAVHRRAAGQWLTERVRATAIVHPEPIARWSAGPGSEPGGAAAP